MRLYEYITYDCIREDMDTGKETKKVRVVSTTRNVRDSYLRGPKPLERSEESEARIET